MPKFTREQIRVDERHRAVVDRVFDCGQDHVFGFWGELSAPEREILLEELAAIDFSWLGRRIAELSEDASQTPDAAETLEPPRAIPIPTSSAEKSRQEEARRLGEDLLRAGRVAVFMVAGGQGTRLGFPHPKGMFPIGPVSGKSLYQLHSEKVMASSRRYGDSIPWMILTSAATHTSTVSFFRQNRFFGLDESNVFFLEQEMIPAVDFGGKLFLGDKGRIFKNPDGHGGALLALRRHGALEMLESRGRDTIFYFQVDNPLVPVPDPVFLGYHAAAEADMSTKAVEKQDPGEKVGLLGMRGERMLVVEYSDLDADTARARDPDGSLRFRAGNFAVHALDRRFVEKLTAGSFELPYHQARKAIPHIDEQGNRVEPETPNGIKFECFIFDALPRATRTVVQLVERAHEFAPLKNAEGENSPKTTRRALSNQYARWLRAAGVDVPTDPDGNVAGDVEISPLYALDESECRDRTGISEFEFRTPLLLGPD